MSRSNKRPRPPNQTRVLTQPHPSIGCGYYYQQDMRTFAMYVVEAGYLDDPLINEARIRHDFPCRKTTSRYEVLLQRLGHYRPCHRNGNARATVLRYHNLVMLTFYRVMFPKCSAAEINAFLLRVNFGDPFFRFYTSSQITYAEQRIGMTRKRGSTTAFQAYLTINLQKRWAYWNLPYPYGIADIRWEDLVNLDECGVYVETADKVIGKSYVGSQVQQAGNYLSLIHI